MNTFLPYPSIDESMSVLDYRRLGKQRVEAWQILNTLIGNSKGWVNHPAVKMWRGYEGFLALYGYMACQEWRRRGYRDSLQNKFIEFIQPKANSPAWYGDNKFHLAHQSNLLRKDFGYYYKFFKEVPNNLPYIWPVN